jgi:hypothetical protein
MGVFIYLVADFHWSGTQNDAHNPNTAWQFGFVKGYQTNNFKSQLWRALAVRNGDLDPDIEADPMEYDFADVETGQTSSSIISVSNAGGGVLTITNIELGGDTFTFVASTLPVDLNGGSSMDISIYFSPVDLYVEETDTLVITSSDTDSPVLEVDLYGTGVEDLTLPEPIIDLKKFIAENEALGNLSSNGPEGKAIAFKDMLTAAGTFMNNGQIEAACGKLNALYKKTDGLPAPKDFLVGPAASELAGYISALMSDLGCP